MTESNDSQLITFAQRVGDLPPEAWERIAARCGVLDHRSVEAFLGRAELVGRVFTFDADPYRHPFVLSALGAWGTLWGLAMEVLHLVHTPHNDLPPGGPVPKPQSEALSRLAAVAHAQRPHHPGAAAACYAVGLALLRSKVAAASIAALYGPFEPEIPFSSLRPDPEQHAA